MEKALPENRNAQARHSLAAWQRQKPLDYLQADPNLQNILEMYMGEAFHRHKPMLTKAARLSATRMDDLAKISNRDENLPLLSRFNNIGIRTEEVVFHPSYHDLGAEIWRTGVLSVLEESGNEMLSGALTYLIAHNGEAGHVCPVACAAGLIKLLQKVGTADQKKRYLPRLLNPDYAQRLHAAQFVTEVQGGSDVALNSCVAEPDDDHEGMYRVSGEKWFCSVIDAGLYVVTARPGGASQGTKGLALFLVPREINGEVNAFAIRRLKYKLGTRSLASAEVDFIGALAEPIGPIEDGFANLMGIVLDTSRVYNAVAACGLMRRACIEAQSYAQHRVAFGRPIIEHPGVASILARMNILTTAAVSTTFRILSMNDQLAKGRMTDEQIKARRTQVNINKYWTAVQCSQVVHDAIEVLGGNGTIEEFSVLPRLYRDAIVLESWEGTHNTLCAQVLRDFSTRNMHLPWLAELQSVLSAIRHPELAEHRSRVARELEEVSALITHLLSGEADCASFRVRYVVDRMCVLNSYLSLLAELDWELGENIVSGKGRIVDLFYHQYVGQAGAIYMEDDELLVMNRAVCRPIISSG